VIDEGSSWNTRLVSFIPIPDAVPEVCRFLLAFQGTRDIVMAQISKMAGVA
jgi:hypothetical protein